jgi:ribonuclease D
MLIDHQHQLEDYCKKWRASGQPLSFDTEFVSDKRYFPLLCLVQVGIGDQKLEAAVDPFKVDLKPLLEMIADPAIEKIVHAGSSDLQILYTQFNCAARNVFDTQIAAAFLGYGQQIGYTDLVQRSIDGPQLSKDWQFSDWTARPLSALQLEYALCDVRFLPAIKDKLTRELKAQSRLAWAETEFARAEIKATESTPPEELYRRLRLSKMNRRQLGRLRELAQLRDEVARQQNKPIQYIISDNALLQLAKMSADSIQDLREIRGMPPLPTKLAQAFVDAAKRGDAIPENELPRLWTDSKPDPEVENIANLLGIAAQIVAHETGIARAYLAPKEELFSLARWWQESASTIEEMPPGEMLLMQDWRRELLGNDLMELLRGNVVITCDFNEKCLVKK